LCAIPIPVIATYQGYGVTFYTSKIDNAVGYGPVLAAFGGASTITLAADPYGADNIPNGSIIAIVGGTGKGQNRTITGYAYSTKIVTVGRAWVTQPDNTSILIIKQLNTARIDASQNVYSVDAAGNAIAPAAVLPAVAAGAKGGLPITDASTGLILTGYNGGAMTTVPSNANDVTALLAALSPISGSVNDASATTLHFVSNLSSAVDDFYKGLAVVFTSGALTGQLGQIAGYTGSSKLVTLQSALTSAPANAVTFRLVNVAASRKLASWLAATVGTDGKTLISADAQDLSGSLGVNAIKIAGSAPSMGEGGIMNVNASTIGGNEINFDDNGLPEVDVEDWRGAQPNLLSASKNVPVVKNETDATGVEFSAAEVAQIPGGSAPTVEEIALGITGSSLGMVMGTDRKMLISDNAQDLHATLKVDGGRFPNGCVYVDAASGISGTTWRNGESDNPVNNLADAVSIANTNKLSKIRVRGNVTIGSDITGFEIIGGGNGAQLSGSESYRFISCQLTDIRINNTSIETCTVLRCDVITSTVNRCTLIKCRIPSALYNVSGFDFGIFIDCQWSGPNPASNYGWYDGTLAYNNGSITKALIIGGGGKLYFYNMNSANKKCYIENFNGDIVTDSGASAGTIEIIGCLGLVSNGGNVTMTYNGVSVPNGTTRNIPAKVSDIPAAPPSAATIAEAVLDEAKGAHTGLLAGVALDSTVAKHADVTALNNVSQQQVRDAMKLTPSAGAPAENSIDQVLADTQSIDEATQALVALLVKYRKNKDAIIVDVDTHPYQVIYDDNGTDILIKKRLKTFDDADIGSLVGTVTPSVAEKSSV
jgi:hypothetical protein